MTVIRWLGQACFLITTLMGTRILIDPPHPEVGYHITAHSIPANLVLVSHEHPDHNFTDAAAPVGGEAPRVVQPLPLVPVGADGSVTAETQSGAYRFGPEGGAVDRVTFTRISAYHDNVGGTQRGPDTITVLTTQDGLRIVHMGDIGQLALDAGQVSAIGRVDVLMIPVGGFYTVNGPQAAALVAQLHPRVIIPMHDRTQALNPDLKGKLAPPAAFLSAMQGRARVVYVRARDLTLSPHTLPATPTIYILRYQ
jgi:L-ascorbate metabolism protein UlaG (beta-lactamase superfamily)